MEPYAVFQVSIQVVEMSHLWLIMEPSKFVISFIWIINRY